MVPAESLSDFNDVEKTLEEQSYPECRRVEIETSVDYRDSY